MNHIRWFAIFEHSLEKVEMISAVVVVPDTFHSTSLDDTHDGDGHKGSEQNNELKDVRPNDSFDTTLRTDKKWGWDVKAVVRHGE